MSNPIDFIRDFLIYVNKEGIYDKFDKDTQKMVTSPGVEALIKEAESYLPKKLKGRAAANLMRDLNEDEREVLIQSAEEGRIIDLRRQFQEKMSVNRGAQGIVERLVTAFDKNDTSQLSELIFDAQALVKGVENVEPIEGEE